VIDTLTGENRILRTDIVHDCGASLNPALDIGQIEGGFVQGAGWLTMEELVWDDDRRAEDTRALDLQDPCLFRPAAHLQRGAVGRGKPRRDDLSLEGGGRTALHARDERVFRAGRMPAAACRSALSRPSGARQQPEAVLAAVHAGAGGGEGMTAIRVTIHRSKGSAPRDAGTAMLVYAEGRIEGTIGGGALEWEAMAHARAHAEGGRGAREGRTDASRLAPRWANAAAAR
jgi:hypothetical protein